METHIEQRFLGGRPWWRPEHYRRRRAQVALRVSYKEVRNPAGRLARDLHDDLSQKLSLLPIEVDPPQPRP